MISDSPYRAGGGATGLPSFMMVFDVLVVCMLQVFVETLDHCFENVCELDLIFHVDKVHNILQETCLGGMVLETNMSEILTHVEAQIKLEKQEASPTSTIRVTTLHVCMLHFSKKESL